MIPPDSNFTYDVDAFAYHPGRSMAGVFYKDYGTDPCFNFLRPYPSLGLPPPFFFNISVPFKICSSSAGLLLCFDSPTGHYHVFNPFYSSPGSYRRIPAPNRPHAFNTRAVLDVDASCTNPVFNIICAVKEKHGIYTFDAYSTATNLWEHDPNELIIGDSSLMGQTGIGYGNGTAYWLTTKPRQGVMYKISSGVHQFDIPKDLSESTALQLGRIDNDSIALVAVIRSLVRVYAYTDGSWCQLRAIRTGGKEMRVMRFETEVPLMSDDRIVQVWEMVDRPKVPGRGWLHEMPAWIRKPQRFGDCIPYVTSMLLAEKFQQLDQESQDLIRDAFVRRSKKRKEMDSSGAPSEVSKKRKVEGVEMPQVSVASTYSYTVPTLSWHQHPQP